MKFVSFILASFLFPLSTNAAITVLVDYQANALPVSPWSLQSDGYPGEIAQHKVYAEDGVLHMIDGARIRGNTLGYYQYVPFDPNQTVIVEFRTRVLSGSSAIGTWAPFDVWLYNGAVMAGLAVGPSSITSMGIQKSVLLNQPIDGTNWHNYKYRLDSNGIEWWVDNNSIGTAPTDSLFPNITATDRRINMFITSASADVELDYLRVTQVPEPSTLLLALGMIIFGRKRK